MKMMNTKVSKHELSEFLNYLATLPPEQGDRIPSLSELSHTLGISIATLREQLEIGRLLGVVDVKPKAGIKKLPYTFKPAVLASLTYALESKSLSFRQLSDFRKHLEAAYFIEAAQLLTKEDISELSKLVQIAKMKLFNPGQLPVQEHRWFHLVIYRHLNNQFLTGMLESYWDLYTEIGLGIYPDLNYATRVWQFHEQIVEQLKAGNFSQGLRLLLEHMEMIEQREKVFPRLSFE